jgi:putative ABC transport system permease protein
LHYVSFFGGMASPLVVPWGELSFGLGACILLCVVAALWPAIATGRAESLKLLHAGRAAM